MAVAIASPVYPLSNVQLCTARAYHAEGIALLLVYLTVVHLEIQARLRDRNKPCVLGTGHVA